MDLQFADRMFQETFRSAGTDNLLISPYSAYALAALLLEGADGQSRTELEAALNEADCAAALSELRAKLRAGGETEFHDANALIIGAGREGCVRDSYRTRIAEGFEAEVFSSGDVIRAVNDWTNEKTLGMIPRLLDHGPAPDLCLLNAIAFVGKWQRMYRPDDVDEEADFTDVEGGHQVVPMLHSTERAWLHGAGLIGFAKPYRGEAYDFVAVLPEDEETPLAAVLPSVSVLKELYQSAENVKTEVTQPEFSFDCSLELNAVFQALGIRSVFSPIEADLSRMTPVPGSYVERVLHKTHIENDREGTKAAAVTAAMVRLGCVPHFEETKFVTLDRPFAFAIFHRETATPVFVGVVNRINQAR